MKIAQLLPFLPPHPHGISDYALKLAEQLLIDYDISSHFISCAEQNAVQHSVEGKFSGSRLPNYDSGTLLSSLPDNLDGVIVHFDFELCRLLHALKFAKQSKLRNTTLIVMFHELIPRWKMSLKQKVVSNVKRVLPARDPGPYASPVRLAKTADIVLTNTSEFQQILSKQLKQHITHLPSFSNVGEPSSVLPLEQRNRRIVVFGTTGTRQRVYKTSSESLFKLCRNLEITEIYDIGVSHGLTLNPPENICVVELGVQSAEQISEILSHSFAGLIDYSHNPGTVGKSGVFAAYCAHGLLPVSSQPLSSEEDGVQQGSHYITLQDYFQDWSLGQFQSIADRAFAWYHKHNLKECTRVFATHLLDSMEFSK